MSKETCRRERERLLGVLAAIRRGHRSFEENERGELVRDTTDERIAETKGRLAVLDAELAQDL